MIYHSKKILVAAVMAIGFLLPAAAQASTIPKAPNNLGLVGYWSFNEGTGTIANDYSGQGNDGIATTTTWTTGKFGNALNFNGTNSYVTGSGAGLPNVGSSANITISAWVKPTNSSATATIFNKGASASCFNYGMMLNGGVLNARDSAHDYPVASSTLPANTWSFVVIVFNGSGAQGYVNASSTGVSSLAVTTNCSNTNWVIGARAYNALSEFFPGTIDEVRVYNRALSATEVAALYKAGGSRIGAPVSPGTLAQGLQGWWTFDGADIGSSFVDRSGNGFSGYLVGSSNSTSTRKTVGKVGQAFSFLSQNTGGVSLGNSASLNPNRFTIAGWIYVNTPQTYNYNYIYSNARDCCGTYNGIDFKVTEPGVVNAVIWNSSASSLNSSSLIATSTWTFVAYTYDGAAMRIYINGKLDNSKAQTTDPGTPASFGTYLGSMGNASGSTFTLNGKLDDMRLYNRALSAAEIQTLYNLTVGTHANTSSATLDNGTSLQTGLVGLWTFDGKDMYRNVADESGQGNTGYLTGFTSTSSAVTIGRFGQGVHNFSATNYIDVPSSSSLNPGSTITVSAWFYPTSHSAYAPFISKLDSSSGTAGWEMAYDLGSGALRTTLRGSLLNVTAGAISLNKWQLGTFTYDGATLKLYLNGALVGTGGGSATINSTGDLLIGKRLINDNSFTGTVDDVRVYNRVLSASEIQQLYNIGK